jgi:predicted ATP-dependent serine protease
MLTTRSCTGLKKASINAIAPAESDAEHQVSTGISGLDNVLGGGLDSYRLYVVEGEPGTGKTTLAFQFYLKERDAERAAFMLPSQRAIANFD